MVSPPFVFFPSTSRMPAFRVLSCHPSFLTSLRPLLRSKYCSTVLFLILSRNCSCYPSRSRRTTPVPFLQVHVFFASTPSAFVRLSFRVRTPFELVQRSASSCVTIMPLVSTSVFCTDMKDSLFNSFLKGNFRLFLLSRITIVMCQDLLVPRQPPISFFLPLLIQSVVFLSSGSQLSLTSPPKAATYTVWPLLTPPSFLHSQPHDCGGPEILSRSTVPPTPLIFSPSPPFRSQPSARMVSLESQPSGFCGAVA